MRLLEHNAALCVGCGICEEVCSQAWFKTTDVELSSIRILDPGPAQPLKAVVCVQCGDCIDLCPAQALSRDRRGIVRLDKKLCVGCLTCVGFCPYGAMFEHHSLDEPFKCVVCGRCVKECPAEALAIVEREG